MSTRRLFAALLALVCLHVGGCREHNEPAKPITGQAGAVSAPFA